MIGSFIIVWVTSGVLAYWMLQSYYQIIPPRYYTLRMVAGLFGGPISLIFCLVLLLRYYRILSK